ncbi:MAG: hypothetical protein GF411_04210 [Candidatus Lokiarchaeota archaeon]|nr:hypothetical protein [Candidatus Lokiarchaeota archaeon]
MAKTPLGVMILGIIHILIGALMFAGAGLLGPLTDWIISPIVLSIANASTIIAIFYIILGICLILMMTWAWYVGIAFAIINVLFSVLGFPSIQWITLIINLLIIFYLNSRGIRRRFSV